MRRFAPRGHLAREGRREGAEDGIGRCNGTVVFIVILAHVLLIELVRNGVRMGVRMFNRRVSLRFRLLYAVPERSHPSHERTFGSCDTPDRCQTRLADRGDGRTY